MVIAGQAAFGLFMLRDFWGPAFEKIVADDESAQLTGIFQLLLSMAGFLAFLFYLNKHNWRELFQVFGGKKTVVGTSERLILGRNDGLNRTVFWEQIRETERDSMTVDLKLALRTGPKPIDAFDPEIIWLTGLKNPRTIHERVQTMVAAKPIWHTGEDSLNFYPATTYGGPEAVFGHCELHNSLLYSTVDFFGKNQLLMLRERIKSAVVEPYDIPKPGWAVVVLLENEARFPLFFTEDLAEAKRAAACFKSRA